MIHQKKGNISVNNEYLNLKLCIHLANMFFFNTFSTFYKIRMRTYINNLRHSSLYSNVFCKYPKFQIYNVNIKGDMHDQKIKVKKYIFR